jgi:hypothetical protein
MLRRCSAIALVLCVGFLNVYAADADLYDDEEELPKQHNTFSIRPKFGANVLVNHGLKDTYDYLLHGELGLKGTFRHFGLECSLGGMYEDESESFSDPALPNFEERERDVTMGVIKLTGTYEFNPYAGLEGHEGEGNIYLGGGVGFYPYTEEFDLIDKMPNDDESPMLGSVKQAELDGFGYGVHVVIGGEYYFARSTSIFGEIQYTYIDIDLEGAQSFGGNEKLFGFSFLAGLSLKF